MVPGFNETEKAVEEYLGINLVRGVPLGVVNIETDRRIFLLIPGFLFPYPLHGHPMFFVLHSCDGCIDFFLGLGGYPEEALRSPLFFEYADLSTRDKLRKEVLL